MSTQQDKARAEAEKLYYTQQWEREDDRRLFSERFYKRHYWYVELVVRSKVMDIEGREPSYHEFAEHGSRVITPDGTETWLWKEVPLISYNSNPRYHYETATQRHLLIFDYRR